jgi:hypothetical protein
MFVSVIKKLPIFEDANKGPTKFKVFTTQVGCQHVHVRIMIFDKLSLKNGVLD